VSVNRTLYTPNTHNTTELTNMESTTGNTVFSPQFIDAHKHDRHITGTVSCSEKYEAS